MPAPSTTGGTGGLMGYPTTVDSNGVFPKTGLAQTSGGTLEYGVPGAGFAAAGNLALTANQALYIPMLVQYTHVLTAWALNVTTGPASTANTRVGLYAADGTVQPTGGPLYDSGSVAVAQSFTGVKSASGLSITLVPGVYLVVVNCDVAMTLQTYVASAPYLLSTLTTTPIIKSMTGSQTYGSFPNPGTVWTTAVGSSSGFVHVIAWQWTE